MPSAMSLLSKKLLPPVSAASVYNVSCDASCADRCELITLPLKMPLPREPALAAPAHGGPAANPPAAMEHLPDGESLDHPGQHIAIVGEIAQHLNGARVEQHRHHVVLGDVRLEVVESP